MALRTPPDFQTAAESAAVELREIPADQPVRLKKQTSNLFRARTATQSALDLSAFDGVYSVNPATRTAVVGGLTTYEDLVAATLPHGLVPMCVPQLRTITIGGAVTGMGIEAASFRNGVPHESVLAMDILLGDGKIVHATPDGPDADLFSGFANSYGSLGYALRLEIELEPVKKYVALRHVPFSEMAPLEAAIAQISATGVWEDQRVDYLDGTVFSPTEMYLTLGHYTDQATQAPSNYSGQDIYYRSIQARRTDLLTTLDYLWRWDTDWFWCSRALGAQNPYLRRVWPRKWLRSDFYWKIIAWDRKLGFAAKLDRARNRPAREPVVQDIEVPLDQLGAFLEFFHEEVGISPIWICPLKQRDPRARWPLYQFDPDVTYVNVGFWSTVPLPAGVDPAEGRINRAIEHAVTALDGRKSLYSTAFYEKDDFYEIYGQDDYAALKAEYDPTNRLTGLFEKCVSGQ